MQKKRAKNTLSNKGTVSIFLLSAAAITLAGILLFLSYENTVSYDKPADLDYAASEIRFYTETCIQDIALSSLDNFGLESGPDAVRFIESMLPSCFDHSDLEADALIRSKTYSGTDVSISYDTLIIDVNADIILLSDGITRHVKDFEAKASLS